MMHLEILNKPFNTIFLTPGPDFDLLLVQHAGRGGFSFSKECTVILGSRYNNRRKMNTNGKLGE